MQSQNETAQFCKLKEIEDQLGFKKKELLKAIRVKHGERKLVVSNIPLDTQPQEIQALFTTAISVMTGNSSLQNVEISEDRFYATLEFSDKASLSTCLLLDGIEFQGRTLRVQKVRNYLASRISNMKTELLEATREHEEAEAIMNSSVFSTQENKLYMGNIPLHLDEGDIKDMLEQFGKLKNFSLVKTSAVGGTSRGF